MRTNMRRAWFLLTVVAAMTLLGMAATRQTISTADDEVVAQFNDRVNAYVNLRNRLAAPLPPFGGARSAWSTLLQRRYLAAGLRTARRGARPGNVFTEPIAHLFRSRFEAALTVDERRRLVMDDDEEGGAPVVLVNEPLASEWLVSLPPAAARALPGLPDGIEYRLVGPQLVLWDAHAEIVIDVMNDAVGDLRLR